MIIVPGPAQILGEADYRHRTASDRRSALSPGATVPPHGISRSVRADPLECSPDEQHGIIAVRPKCGGLPALADRLGTDGLATDADLMKGDIWDGE